MTIDPYFEVGYHVDRYYELEEDFLKVMKYMPLEMNNTPDTRERATSTYLADLLIRIGSNIDITFRKMILSNFSHIYDEKLSKINEKRKAQGKEPLSEINLNFEDYRRLNSESIWRVNGKLSDCKVTIIQTGEFLTPFEDWKEEKTPTWWSSYNHVKHHAEFDKANLNNVIQALAALLLLICINKHSIKLLNYGYLCIDPKFKRMVITNHRKESHHDIITKIFISPIQS